MATDTHAEKKSGAAAKVVPLFAGSDAKESEKKWSRPVMDLGYCILPSILLQAQGRLNISAQTMMVMLQLVEHWWRADGKVFPSKETIGDRVNLSPKQVQRHVKILEDRKLVKRIARYRHGQGRTTNQYDLTGLVDWLKAIEPEVRKAKKVASDAKKAGGLPTALSKAKIK
ncbi:MAG: helix-turn-helix domain-containing protein [Casimicrobiaceae bacterium]